MTAAEQIKLLREALRFYRDGFEQRLETFRDGHTVIYVPSDKLKKDCGDTAKHALAATEAAPATWHGMKAGDQFAPDLRSMVSRVPGGWIYGCEYGVCFVPFNNEFQEVNENDPF